MLHAYLSGYSVVIPALGAGIHALGAARCKGVDAGTAPTKVGFASGSRHDGAMDCRLSELGAIPWR